jgi:hypothetical protein
MSHNEMQLKLEVFNLHENGDSKKKSALANEENYFSLLAASHE